MKHLFILCCFLISFSSIHAQKKYKLRKYQHVKDFYDGITKEATEICLKNNIPPAALLAIAGLESGWNNGYIGRISGNILSLNVNRKDLQLPPLYLPTLKGSNIVLFDSLEIKKYNSDQLVWKQRPESYKKDYRPKPWRGTKYNLAYFKYHPKEKKKAHLKNIEEFVTSFIGRKSKIKAYREARAKMDELVKIHGKNILLKEETAITFVQSIGGKPNSYNFRETWPKKVISIIKTVGLIALTKETHEGTAFYESWSKN